MENTKHNQEQLYNSRIIDAYVKLVKNRYSFVDIGAILDHAGMKEYEIADQGHWFSQDQVERFYERLVHATGNENIARDAGRYAASPDALGVMRQFALGLIDPANAFALIEKASSNFTRSAVYHSRKLAANRVEISVIPLFEGLERPFQCSNRVGFFEAIVLMLTNRLPEISHEECIFSGGKVCRYVVTWEKPRFALLREARGWIGAALLAGSVGLGVAGQVEALTTFVPASALLLLALSLAVEQCEKREMTKSLESTKDSIDRLLDQININYNNALMTNEIGKALSTAVTTDDILANVVQILERRLDYDRGLILLANQERTSLVLQAGYGYTESEMGFFGKLSFHLDRSDSKGIFVLSFREKKPYLVNDLDEIGDTLSPRSLAFAKRLGTHSFICCPIVREDTSIGILAVDNVKSKRPLVQSDMSLLMGIASVIAVSIRNVELLNARMRQFNSILQVLAASIDARDSLTAGHSEKVTEYSEGICHELGLAGDYRDMIRVASLLHDYGKLGIPDAILKKEGKLSAEEYEVVKTHSAKTRDILSQIHFEGIYCQVPAIAGAHHEKIDGTGYPMGLKEHEIPLGARIIAVADYFEAITSKRHYRDPMAVQEAFAMLRLGSGSHFEERIVEAFIRYYTRVYLDRKPTGTRIDGMRRRTRITYRVPVAYRVNGRTAMAVSEDISPRGLYLATDDEVIPGSELELTITMPDEPAVLVEAAGRVAWVNDWRDRKKPEFPEGFGVELLEFRNAAEELFLSFMNRSPAGAYSSVGG